MVNKNYGFIHPEYLKPELSTKLYRTTFNYLKKFYNEEIFKEVCAELQMPIHYLLDDDNWVSVYFGSRFAELIEKKTYDPDIYRKIGNYYLSADNINTFEYTLVRSLSPYLMLKTIKQFYRKTNTVCHLEVMRLGFNKVQANFTSTTPLYRGMMINTLGVVEAFRDLYELDAFKTQLQINSAKELTSFSLTVEFSAAKYYLRRLVWIIGLCLIGYLLGYGVQAAEYYFGSNLTPFLGGVIAILITIYVKLWENLRILKNANLSYYDKTREKNIHLYQKSELLERRYREVNHLKQLSSELIASKDPISIIKKCLESTRDKFKYRKMAIFLHSKERKKLYLSFSVGFESLTDTFTQLEFDFPNPDAKDLFFASVLERGQSALIIDIDNYKSLLKEQNRQILDILDVGSIIVSPIQSQNEKHGLFVLIRDKNEDVLLPQDKFLIDSITSQLSLYFESASNLENEMSMRSIFQKYVPRPVLEAITESKYASKGNMKPQRARICSVFIDLRGFTTICDGMSPEKVFELINTYASYITQTFAEHGAIIDNIIGDEVVSFFIQKDHHSDYIFKCFHAILDLLENIDTFQSEIKNHGFPPLAFGIGIHSGEASIGSVGSDFKMNFTALGSTVNIASRLQSISKKYSTEAITILASEELINEAQTKLNQVHLKVQNGDIEGLSKSRLQEEVLRGHSESTRFYKIQKMDLMDLIKKNEQWKNAG